MQPVEEYTLSGLDCPIGTVLGPGRYGMYWVVRSINENGGRVMRSALPTDLKAVLTKDEPHSIVEFRLRKRRGVNSDESRASYAEGERLRSLLPQQGRQPHGKANRKPH